MNLMVTFGGAVNYGELRDTPIPELVRLHEEAARVLKQMK